MQISNKIKRQKRIAYSIFGIGFILLLSANALAWLFLQQISGLLVADLAFRLENIAQISSKLIDPTDLMYLIQDDPADPAVIYYQQLLAEVHENNMLRIAIKDNGSGIDPANSERIFEPFFSTRDSGSGLGLTISRRLIERLGGSLKVTSEPGRGTTVTLYLPRDWERG